MGNIGDLWRDYDPLTNDTAHSGTGSVTTLPMTDEETAAVVQRPIGFVWPEPQ